MTSGQTNFGNPDADADEARGQSHLQEIFVQHGAVQRFMDDDYDTLAVAGPKGVGKTLLLFNKNLAVRNKSGTLVFPTRAPHAYRPNGEFAQLIRSEAALKGKLTKEAWTALWEWALSASVLEIWRQQSLDGSHSRHKDSAALVAIEDDVIGPLSEDPYVNIVGFLRAASSGVYSRAGVLSIPSATRNLKLMSDLANEFPPTYLYIDNQDDFFGEEPTVWETCGFGTFRALRTIRARSDRRVHCCMALRSEVYWGIAKGADALRYNEDIVLLQWQHDMLRSIFKRRVALMRPDRLRVPDLASSDPVKAFFGKLDGGGANDREPLIRTEVETRAPQEALDYLLRFTLGRPRDLIFLGNAIVVATSESPCGSDEAYAQLLRDTVHDKAGEIAEAYFDEVKHRWPWTDIGYGVDLFLQQHVPSDLLTLDQLRIIKRQFADEINQPPDKVHPFCELARLGLLGWPRNQVPLGWRIHFPAITETPVPSLPGDTNWFAVHPILQRRFTIRPNGRILIQKNEPFDESLLKGYSGVTVRP